MASVMVQQSPSLPHAAAAADYFNSRIRPQVGLGSAATGSLQPHRLQPLLHEVSEREAAWATALQNLHGVLDKVEKRPLLSTSGPGLGERSQLSPRADPRFVDRFSSLRMPSPKVCETTGPPPMSAPSDHPIVGAASPGTGFPIGLQAMRDEQRRRREGALNVAASGTESPIIGQAMHLASEVDEEPSTPRRRASRRRNNNMRRRSLSPAAVDAVGQRQNQRGSKMAGGSRLLYLVLVASLVFNALLMRRYLRGPLADDLFAKTPVGPADVKDSSLDRDGDGIPDHHDLCSTGNGASLSSGEVWRSGRATDFDGDGCQDGLEDSDQDNDGVNDDRDNCPKTPQRYGFVSNVHSDFDVDGCADGIEDTDDDGDGVNDVHDRCPRTLLVRAAGEVADEDGCSQKQRLARALAEAEAAEEKKRPSLHHDAALAAHVQVLERVHAQAARSLKGQQPEGWDIKAEIRGAWAEIAMGFVLTWILASGQKAAGRAWIFFRGTSDNRGDTPPASPTWADDGADQLFRRHSCGEVLPEGSGSSTPRGSRPERAYSCANVR